MIEGGIKDYKKNMDIDEEKMNITYIEENIQLKDNIKNYDERKSFRDNIVDVADEWVKMWHQKEERKNYKPEKKKGNGE